jgi:hypothetical protein
MRTQPTPGSDVGVLLDGVEGTAPIEAVEAAAETLADRLGARELAFLIADFSGRAVVRLTTRAAGVEGARRQAGAQAETVPMAGTVYERVLRTQVVDVQALDGDAARLIAPVTDRGDAIGVLELVLPGTPSAAVVADVAAAAHALAYVVIAARRYTDVFEWGQRTTPFSLAAEIQRRLLPASYTCEAGQFTLAGWLEPAASVGGDTFDYTLNEDALHLSITDAVGHEVDAALLATLLVGALRNARRRGLDLDAQARYANEALVDNAAAGRFVTGQLVRVDLVTGRSFRVQRCPLQPGDRVVFLTDGVQERNAAVLDVATALRDTTDLHPREVVQALGAAVLQATGGDLRDDATLVCLDWYGGPPRRRDGGHGADAGIASPARSVPHERT